MTPKTYRKRPVEITAMQWDGTAQGATPIIDWILSHGGSVRSALVSSKDTSATARLDIDTLEGTMSASTGDYVIRGVQGEFYPCKPDIFTATYEETADQ